MNRKNLIKLNVFFFILLLNFQFFKFNYVFQIFFIWLLTLIPLYKDRFIKNLLNNKQILIYSTIWYLPVLVSVFYSQNINEGLNSVQKSLFLLVFPVIFLAMEKEMLKRLLKTTIIVFPLSTLLFVLFIFYKVCFYWYQPYVFQYGQPNIIEYMVFVYKHRFSYLLESSDILVVSQFVHKAYLGIFILISIVFLQFWRKLWLRLIFQIILFVCLILFKAKTQILIGIIVFAYIGYILFNKNRKIIYIMIVFCVGLLVANKNKIDNILDYNNSLSHRVYVSYCASKIFLKNPLFGIGLGDLQEELNCCYENKKCFDCKSLNTHNYYFNILGASGIIGLFLFLFCYYQVFKIALVGSKEFLIVLIIIFASLITENLFSRMWGTLSYGLFANLLLSYKINSEL